MILNPKFLAEKEKHSPKGHYYITNYSPSARPLKPCNSKLKITQILQRGPILCKEGVIVKRKATTFKEEENRTFDIKLKISSLKKSIILGFIL
jgi:hypothetical protein